MSMNQHDLRINGAPVRRFRLLESNGNVQSFSAGWERAAAFHRIEKLDAGVTATNWDKATDTWVDATEEARDEGNRRAERANLAKGTAAKPEKVKKPSLPAHVADQIKAHAEVVKTVAQIGRKEGVDEDTKRMVGMSAMELLANVGYSPKEIRELAKQFYESSMAQVQAGQSHQG